MAACYKVWAGLSKPIFYRANDSATHCTYSAAWLNNVAHIYAHFKLLLFSSLPNAFIFHSHRATRDLSVNFLLSTWNSWRRSAGGVSLFLHPRKPVQSYLPQTGCSDIFISSHFRQHYIIQYIVSNLIFTLAFILPTLSIRYLRNLIN